MAKARGGLGKGLDALFQDNTTEDAGAVNMLSLGEIEPNRGQPRKQFDNAALTELADSIREHGVLQPLVVRPLPGGTYQLVAGERRWRASRMAGLTQVPVIIREMTDAQAMEIALVENLQREDLNPLEEAHGYKELMDRFELTQEQVAARVGKSRPVVTNALRLLGLPGPVMAMVQSGQISAGHGRALLAFEETALIKEVAQQVVAKGLSVRQVEQLAKEHKKAKDKPAKKPIKNAWNNAYFTEVQIALSHSLSRKVKVEGDGSKGQLVIEFYDEEDLRGLACLLDRD